MAAALLVLWRPLWHPARHVLTIVHEGAHGATALLVGRRLRGIRLHSDTSGLTVSSGRPTGAGMVATVAAGYVGPALLGLLAAYLLRRGETAAVLWTIVVLLALLLLQIRNWYGLWVLLVVGAVTFGVTWWGGEQTQAVFAYTVTWFLLLGSPRPVLELQTQRRHRRSGTSDADQLARLTHVPALVWVGVFALVAVGALLLGGSWLVATV